MFHLGIDGGGTGCRAVLAAGDGRILAHAQGGPANIASDYDGARHTILTLVAQVTAGHCAADQLRAVLGLAGTNLSGAAGRLQAELPFAARVVQDVTTSVRGALGAQDGIVAAIGTGSVFARQRRGQVHAIGGWGLRLGDEASGAWIGRQLVARATRARDGFVPMTPLLRDLMEELGGPAGLVGFSLRATPADWARYAPRVLGNDDPAAHAVLAQAQAEIRAAMGVLQPEQPLPVTWIGGLGPLLALPDWPTRAACGTALDGALALAQEETTWTD